MDAYKLLMEAELLWKHRKIVESLGLIEKILKDNRKIADVWRLKGEVLLSIKQKRKGLNSLIVSYKIAGDRPWQMGCLAVGYTMVNKKELAEKFANKALQVECLTQQDLLGRAFAERILNKYEECIATLNIVLDKDYQNTRALNSKAIVLDSLKNYEEALATISSAILFDANYCALWNTKGNILKDLKRYDEALEAYNKAISIDSGSPFPWNNKGTLLGDLKRYDEALEAYDQAISIDPEYSAPWNNKGTLLGDLKRYDEALEAYNKAISIDSGSPFPWNGKGNILKELKRYDEALEAYDQAISIDPEYSAPWNNKGNILGDLKRYDEALEAYDQAISINPGSSFPWNGKGNILKELKRYDEALEAYDQAISIDPEYTAPWNGKGIILKELKRYDEALEAYDQVISIDPEYSAPWNNKGNLLGDLKRYDEALESYNRAISIDPEYSASWNGRGIILKELKRYDEALESYNKAISIDSGSPFPWNNKGNLLGDLKHYDEALDAYDKAISIDPEYTTPWNGKGIILKELKRYPEALEAYEKAISIDPGSAFPWNNKGNILRKLKRYSEALDAYDRAIIIDHTYSIPWNGKGNVLRILKKYDEALAAYDNAIKIDPKYALAWDGKGHALQNLMRYKEAIDAFEKSLEFDKTSISSFNGKHQILELVKGKFNLKVYESSEENNIEFGQIELEHGSLDRAQAWFDAAISLAPHSEEAVYFKGITSQKQGDFKGSIALFDKIINTPCGTGILSRATLAKASSLCSLEQYDEAEKLLIKFSRMPNLSTVTTQEIESLISNIRAANELKQRLSATISPSVSQTQEDESGSGLPQHTPLATDTHHRYASIDDVLEIIKRKKDSVQEIIADMDQVKVARSIFLSKTNAAKNDISFFLILRRWNSYTPIIPSRDADERSLGGGYYIRHNNIGVVIDPGLNFIENFSNAGLRMADINAIVITHSHNDHTADLESLLTMSHMFNEDKKRDEIIRSKTGLDLYINICCLKKFSGFIDLNARYINNIRCITPGEDICLGDEKFLMRVLPAYHDELLSNNYAVGLKFILQTSSEPIDKRSILLTSDTSLFPQKTESNGKQDSGSDITEPEIWEKYGDLHENKKIDLMIVHLGSIKKKEFDDVQIGKRLYKNHLGMIGTVRIISVLLPKLAIISEFGEELSNKKIKLTDAIIDSVSKLVSQDDMPQILPGDIGFEYNITNGSVFCLLPDYRRIKDGGKLVNYKKVSPSLYNKKICYCANNFLNKDSDGNTPSIDDAFKKLKASRKRNYAWYLDEPSDQTDQSSAEAEAKSTESTRPPSRLPPRPD